MTGLFARAGVDYGQWRAVTRTMLRSDFRAVGTTSEAYSLRTAGGLFMLALVYGGIGFAAALLVVLNADVLLTGTIALTYLAVVLATTVLTQHAAILLSAGDHAVLAPRPVSSRTVLAIRLTNVLFHTLLVTTLTAYPVIAAYTVARGVSLTRGLAAAAAIYGWSLALSLALAAGYGALLRGVGATRLQRAVAYGQLTVSLAAYGGLFLALRTLGAGALSDAAMPRGPWLLALPPAWFASYLEIAAGDAAFDVWLRAGLSVSIIVLLGMALRGRLGSEYTEGLSRLVLTDRAAAAPAGQPWLFRRDEARAVAILVRAHFRHDLRVRLAVLGVVPIALFYLVIGASEPGLGDPFRADGRDQPIDYLALAVLLLPGVVTQHLTSSDAYAAAWIYGVTPASRRRLLSAIRSVATAYFVLPFLGLVAALFWWRFGHAGHALAHAGMLGLVSHVALQAAFAISPRLPFSRPPEKAMAVSGLFVWLLVVIAGGQVVLALLTRWVYITWPRTVMVASTLVLMSWLLEKAVGRRAAGAAIPN